MPMPNVYKKRATTIFLIRVQRRVEEWQQRLQPTLNLEEKREGFDMKVYGQRVLDSIRALNGEPHATTTRHRACHRTGDWMVWVPHAAGTGGVVTDEARPFASVSAGVQPFHVSRLFLATLQVCAHARTAHTAHTLVWIRLPPGHVGP